MVRSARIPIQDGMVTNTIVCNAIRERRAL